MASRWTATTCAVGAAWQVVITSLAGIVIGPTLQKLGRARVKDNDRGFVLAESIIHFSAPDGVARDVEG